MFRLTDYFYRIEGGQITPYKLTLSDLMKLLEYRIGAIRDSDSNVYVSQHEDSPRDLLVTLVKEATSYYEGLSKDGWTTIAISKKTWFVECQETLALKLGSMFLFLDE